MHFNLILISFIFLWVGESQAQSCCATKGGSKRCESNRGYIKCFNGDLDINCPCTKIFRSSDVSPVENSFKFNSGKNWQCKKGFRFLKGNCRKVHIPKNAILSKEGVSFVCLPGFKRLKNRCVKIRIPENAHYSSVTPGWKCNKGYSQKRNQCLKLKVPKNAILNKDGKTWTCTPGYVRYRARCKKE